MQPHTELTKEDNDILKKFSPTPPFNDMIVYPHGPVVMPRTYLQIAERIANFEVREDDIWIVTYPKSGTTWTQEMVWQIVNNVDIEGGKLPLFVRTPFLECGCIVQGPPPKSKDQPELPPDVAEKLNEMFTDPITYADKMTGRRVIKSHMPLEMLPKDVVDKCKVIYVARNIKDQAVSYFNHCVILPPHDFMGNFEDFCDLHEKNLHFYGSYFHHLKSGWALRDHPNVRFVWFEDMKKDIRKEVLATCEFIDHPLTSEQVNQLLDHISFKSMKNNMSINIKQEKGEFLRKGEVGDHKNTFDKDRNGKWDLWIKNETLNTGIVLPGL